MIRAMRLGLALLTAAALLSACRAPEGENFGTAQSQAATGRDLHVLFIADPHLDLFRDRTFVRKLEAAPAEQWPGLLRTAASGPNAAVGRDANPALFVSALEAMQKYIPAPDAVMVAGDVLAHDFRRHFLDTAPAVDDASYHRFIDNTADAVPLLLHAVYPAAQILPTVGNNDGYCGDYQSTPRDAFLAHQAKTYETFVNRDERSPDFVTDYARGGYYSARLANGVRVLALNSIVFSDRYENACGDPAEHPAASELQWLRKQTESNSAPPTLVLTHIPPGIDAFKSFLHLGKPNVFYNAAVQSDVLDLLTLPQAHVTTMLTGHLHNVGYRVLASNSGRPKSERVPAYSAPSISPIFGNAPAFAVLDISDTGNIDDITVYELRTGVPGLKQKQFWFKAYNFNQRYAVHGLSVDAVETLHAREQSDVPFRETVERDRVSGGPATAIGQLQWRTAWCAEVALTPRQYLRCEGFQH